MNALRLLSLWIVLSAGSLLSTPAAYGQYSCKAIFALSASQELPTTLRISTYNLNHLEATTLPEHIEKSKKLKTTINEINADVLVLTEIVDVSALREMVSRLNNPYQKFLIEGNDFGGGHIAILLKKDLPIEATYETHRNMKWRDPTTNLVEPVFTRDAPALILKKQGAAQPFLIIVGIHSKSQRNRLGDPRSEIQRTAEFKAYLSVIEKFNRIYRGTVPVVLAGDFNTDVMTAREFKVLKERLFSAFDVAKESIPVRDRVTHTYHPENRPTAFHQIDDILIPPSLTSHILRATVHRYKDPFGNILPFADSYESRSQQPSDHLPISIDISTDMFQ
jgi:exonuclease III